MAGTGKKATETLYGMNPSPERVEQILKRAVKGQLSDDDESWLQMHIIGKRAEIRQIRSERGDLAGGY